MTLVDKTVPATGTLRVTPLPEDVEEFMVLMDTALAQPESPVTGYHRDGDDVVIDLVMAIPVRLT